MSKLEKWKKVPKSFKRHSRPYSVCYKLIWNWICADVYTYLMFNVLDMNEQRLFGVFAYSIWNWSYRNRRKHEFPSMKRKYNDEQL